MCDAIKNPTYDEKLPLYEKEDFDIINNPKHYANKKIEVIDYIEDTLKNNPTLTAYEGYLIGNVIKYLSRAGLKDDKGQYFKKAQYYIHKLNKVGII